MKHLLLAISVIFFLSSCTQEKVAFVDVEEIYKEYNKAKEAEQEMTMQSQKMSMEIEELRASFQQKVQEYQSSSSTLSDKDKQQKEQELMREQQEIQQRQQMARQLIQEESKNKMEKIDEDIKSYISKYAKSKSFTLVLGTSSQTKSVLYADSSKDITVEIIESLNDEYESEEKTEEAAE
jgi:outer membrane protein